MSDKELKTDYHFTNVKHQYLAAVVGNTEREIINLNIDDY